MTELPIACTLTADGMTARLALIDALATDGLLDRTATDTGLRVRLRDRPDLRTAGMSSTCSLLPTRPDVRSS